METADPLKHPPSDAFVAIILAAAATEAFINELAELVSITRIRLDETLTDEQRSFADVIRKLESERPRGALQKKYLGAAEALGSPFDPGSNPFQDFNTLVKLRDSLMHVKPNTDTEVDSDGRLRTPMPAHIRALQQRGLARRDTNISWFDALLTQEIADWAPATARTIMLAVLDQFPDDSVRSLWGLVRNLT